MGPETIATLAGVAIAVAAIAVALIAIAWRLRRIDGALARVQAGAGTIAGQVAPVEGVLGGIASETHAIAEALTGLVALAAESAGPRTLETVPIDLASGEDPDGDDDGLVGVAGPPARTGSSRSRPQGGTRRRRSPAAVEAR